MRFHQPRISWRKYWTIVSWSIQCDNVKNIHTQQIVSDPPFLGDVHLTEPLAIIHPLHLRLPLPFLAILARKLLYEGFDGQNTNLHDQTNTNTEYHLQTKLAAITLRQKNSGNFFPFRWHFRCTKVPFASSERCYMPVSFKVATGTFRCFS